MGTNRGNCFIFGEERAKPSEPDLFSGNREQGTEGDQAKHRKTLDILLRQISGT